MEFLRPLLSKNRINLPAASHATAEWGRRGSQPASGCRIGWLGAHGVVWLCFIHEDRVRKGRPLVGLFAVRDCGLHLNLIRRQVFTDHFKMALSTRQLYPTAVAAASSIGVGVVEWCIWSQAPAAH